MALIATAALLGGAGCGSDDNADDQAATTAAAGGGQVSATTPDRTTTQATTETATDGGQLSPQARAVLDASQDLAADVSETAQEFGRGRIDEDEARARLELASARADDLRERAEQLPAADRARARLALLNEQISRTASTVSRELSAGRAASREEIDEQIARLRDEARATVDAVSEQLDRQTRERVREALDRIGATAPG